MIRNLLIVGLALLATVGVGAVLAWLLDRPPAGQAPQAERLGVEILSGDAMCREAVTLEAQTLAMAGGACTLTADCAVLRTWGCGVIAVSADALADASGHLLRARNLRSLGGCEHPRFRCADRGIAALACTAGRCAVSWVPRHELPPSASAP